MPFDQLHTRTCTHCNYTALVLRNRHYVSSCEQEMDTVHCSNCQELSIVEVTKPAAYLPHPTREEFRKIYDANPKEYRHDFELCYYMYETPRHCEQLKRVHCTWCNSHKTSSWDATNAACPKCGASMKETQAPSITIPNASSYKGYNRMVKSAENVVAVLVDDWCFPCKILIPTLQRILNEHPGQFHFVMFDTKYAYKNNMTKMFKIKVLPYFILYKHGLPIAHFQSPSTVKNLVKKLKLKYGIIT